MKFVPWDTIPNKEDPFRIDVDGPPCTECKHWDPQAIYSPNEDTHDLEFDGIRLCWKRNMFRDFSCYKSKED